MADLLVSHPARPSGGGRSNFVWLSALVVGLALAFIGVERGMLGADRARVLHVVVLNESSTSKIRCPSCVTYVEQYAGTLARDASEQVWVEHLSWHPRAGPPVEIQSVHAQPPSGMHLRQSLGSADLIVLSVGDEHSLITIREDSCDRVASSSCTTSVNEFEHQMRALLTAIDAIRHPGSRVVVVAAPDPHHGEAAAASESACEATRAVQGVCVDTMQLVASGALSATDWHGPANTLAMDQAGHDAIAGLVLQHEDR